MGTYCGEQLGSLVGRVTAEVKAPYSGGSEIHHGLLMKHTGERASGNGRLSVTSNVT